MSPGGLLRVSAALSFGRLYVAPLLPVLAARQPAELCLGGNPS